MWRDQRSGKHVLVIVGADDRLFGKSFLVTEGMGQVIEIRECRGPRRAHHQVKMGFHRQLVLQRHHKPKGGQAPRRKRVNEGISLNRKTTVGA